MARDSRTEPPDDAPSPDLTPALLTGCTAAAAAASLLTVTHAPTEYNIILHLFTLSRRVQAREEIKRDLRN